MDASNESVAKKISLVLSAPVVALVAVVVFSFRSPIGLGPCITEGSSILLGTLFLSILPITPVLYYAKKGVVDIDVSERSMRPRLFAMAIVGYSLGAIVFWFLSATSLMVLSLAYVCVTSSMALISLFWKASVHAAGIAGPVTGLTYVLGWPLASMYLLLLPIAWARLRLKAHSAIQVLAGAVVAILVTFTVYCVLYPAPPKSWLSGIADLG